MTQLPLQEGILRFRSNEAHIDKFVNGGPNESYLTSDGVGVPSIRNFLEQNFNIIESLPDTYVPKYRLNNLDGKNLNQQKQGFFHVEGPQPTDGSLLNTPDPKAFALTGIQSGDIGRGMQIVVPYYNEDPGLNAMFWRRSGDGWNSQWRVIWDSENLPITDFAKGALQAPDAAAFRSYIGAGSTGGGTAGVTTFNSRAGNVYPSPGDYNAGMIEHDGNNVGEWIRHHERKSSHVLVPEEWGAVGDGVTDDTTALQACLNSIPLEGRAVVLLTKKYLINGTLTVYKRSINFQGIAWAPHTRATGFVVGGNGKVFLNDCDGCSFEKVVFKAASTKQNNFLVELDNAANIVFSGVNFDGASSDNIKRSRAVSIVNGSNRVRFLNVIGSGFTGPAAFYITDSNIFDFNTFSLGGDKDTTAELMRFAGSSGSARFTNCAFNFAQTAIMITDKDAITPGFFYFAACGWENFSVLALNFDAAKNIQVLGCYMACGIRVTKKCEDVRIVGNVVRASPTHGIQTEGKQVVIANNTISRNSNGSSGVYAGVRILAGAKNHMVIGNQMGREWQYNPNDTETESTALQRYCIQTDMPASEGIIANNFLREGFTDAAIGGLVTTGPGIVNNLA